MKRSIAILAFMMGALAVTGCATKKYVRQTVDPVSGNYVFGGPLFDRVTIKLGNSKTLVIESVGNAPDQPYVQSVTWNGQPYTKSWFSHAQIAEGGKFVIHMGAQPNERFGADFADRPPSFA